MQRAGLLDEIGGMSYLSSLMDGVPKSLNVEYYAQIIKEKALLRRLIVSSAKIISASYEQKEEADDLLNEAQASIIEVADQRIRPGFIPVRMLTEPTLEMIQKLTERKEAVTGVPSGFRSLDSLTSGFHPSELVIVAARPSMGKTALALNIAQHAGDADGHRGRLLLDGDGQGTARHPASLRRGPAGHQEGPDGLHQRAGIRQAQAGR